MIKIVSLTILLCYWVALVNGHAMLADPPGRPVGKANSFGYSGGFVAQFYYRGIKLKKSKHWTHIAKRMFFNI